jgi:uncharacterized membrane protein
MLFFVIVNWNTIRSNAETSLTWTTLGVLVISPVLSAFVANLLFLYVLTDHSSYMTTALVYSSPVFTVLFAWLVLKEDVTVKLCIGVLLVVMGILLLAAEQ